MKRLIALTACLLVFGVAARAQFEKGQWRFATALTGLNFNHDTENSRTTFGVELSGGAFIVDNTILSVHVGAEWNEGDTERDTYTAGVGVRYYFDRVGIFVGLNGNIARYNYDSEWKAMGYKSDTRLWAGFELGYCFFLSRTVAIEPSLVWDLDKDRSRFGLNVAFGFYF